MSELRREDVQAMVDGLHDRITGVLLEVRGVAGEVSRVEQKLDDRDEALRRDVDDAKKTAQCAKKAAGRADTSTQVNAARMGLFGMGGGGLVAGLLKVLERVTGAQ